MQTRHATAVDPSAAFESLTREYARYSRRAGGLSAVTGGALGLVSFALGAAAPSSPGLTAALLAMPLLWLASRQVMVRHYQRLGRVTESEVPSDRAMQRYLTTAIAMVCMAVVAGTFVTGGSPTRWSGSEIAFAALVLAMPLAAWRWLHTPLDLVVGVLLLSQAALAIRGESHALGSAAVPAVGSLLLVARGWVEHRRFLGLDAELRRLRARTSDA